MYHKNLHTHVYYDTVYELLKDAKSKEDVVMILGDIGSQLLSGTFAR